MRSVYTAKKYFKIDYTDTNKILKRYDQLYKIQTALEETDKKYFKYSPYIKIHACAPASKHIYCYGYDGKEHKHLSDVSACTISLMALGKSFKNIYGEGILTSNNIRVIVLQLLMCVITNATNNLFYYDGKQDNFLLVFNPMKKLYDLKLCDLGWSWMDLNDASLERSEWKDPEIWNRFIILVGVLFNDINSREICIELDHEAKELLDPLPPPATGCSIEWRAAVVRRVDTFDSFNSLIQLIYNGQLKKMRPYASGCSQEQLITVPTIPSVSDESILEAGYKFRSEELQKIESDSKINIDVKSLLEDASSIRVCIIKEEHIAKEKIFAHRVILLLKEHFKIVQSAGFFSYPIFTEDELKSPNSCDRIIQITEGKIVEGRRRSSETLARIQSVGLSHLFASPIEASIVSPTYWRSIPVVSRLPQPALEQSILAQPFRMFPTPQEIQMKRQASAGYISSSSSQLDFTT